VSDVAANQAQWMVSPLQAKQCFEAMSTHHGQLKAMYGILHLAAKIIDMVDVKETLFVDVVGHTVRSELEPIKWRAAVRMEPFFDTRHFGFHYKVNLASCLRRAKCVRKWTRMLD
jgi:hypothetical protein